MLKVWRESADLDPWTLPGPYWQWHLKCDTCERLPRNFKPWPSEAVLRFKEMPGKAWLPNPRNAFHPWEETEVEHTIGLKSRKSICLEHFNTRTNSLADFTNNHLILNLNWPLHLSLEIEVKMTSKRPVISLIFVIKCISKRFLLPIKNCP